MTPESFIRLVKSIALEHGARITSYKRTPSHNAEVGGSPNSLHLVGLAADLVPMSKELADAFRQAGLYVLDKVHGTGPHVHVQARPLLGGAGTTTGPIAPPPPLDQPAEASSFDIVDVGALGAGDCSVLEQAATVLKRIGWTALEAALTALVTRAAAKALEK